MTRYLAGRLLQILVVLGLMIYAENALLRFFR